MSQGSDIYSHNEMFAFVYQFHKAYCIKHLLVAMNHLLIRIFLNAVFCLNAGQGTYSLKFSIFLMVIGYDGT